MFFIFELYRTNSLAQRLRLFSVFRYYCQVDQDDLPLPYPTSGGKNSSACWITFGFHWSFLEQ